MTLARWGASDEHAPLKIAVSDDVGQSPFSIAVLRIHRAVARAILEIALAQYEPKTDVEKARYRLAEEDEDSDDASSCSNDVQVYKELIDDRFTIDNIGEVATQVKSQVSPLAFMQWPCYPWNFKRILSPDTKFTYGMENTKVETGGALSLISWTVTANDKDMFSFLIDLTTEWTERMTDKTEESPTLPIFAETDFRLTVKYGRLDMLAEVIRRYGAGIDVGSLVKKSGVKFVEKPKYYQGLSVSRCQHYLVLGIH